MRLTARVVPILEACSMMIRPTTSRQDDTENDDAEDHKDFDTAEPELKLAEEADAEVVDGYNCHEKDCDPDARIHSISRDP